MTPWRRFLFDLPESGAPLQPLTDSPWRRFRRHGSERRLAPSSCWRRFLREPTQREPTQQAASNDSAWQRFLSERRD